VAHIPLNWNTFFELSNWNTFFELSFTTYFGEIYETKKNPTCVYRERERERDPKQRENKVFFHFFCEKTELPPKKIKKK
jgi:hypothetical protein